MAMLVMSTCLYAIRDNFYLSEESKKLSSHFFLPVVTVTTQKPKQIPASMYRTVSLITSFNVSILVNRLSLKMTEQRCSP